MKIEVSTLQNEAISPESFQVAIACKTDLDEMTRSQNQPELVSDMAPLQDRLSTCSNSGKVETSVVKLSSDFDIPIGETTRYRNVQDFWRQKRIAPRREKFVGQFWRLADQTYGSVHGLDQLNGFARVTDGVVLIVETVEGRLFDCMLENWRADKRVSSSSPKKVAVSERPECERKLRISLEQLADLLAT